MGAYRITVRDEKGKYHVWTTAEGPTPLLTLHEACEGSSAEAGNNLNYVEVASFRSCSH